MEKVVLGSDLKKIDFELRLEIFILEVFLMSVCLWPALVSNPLNLCDQISSKHDFGSSCMHKKLF